MTLTVNFRILIISIILLVLLAFFFLTSSFRFAIYQIYIESPISGLSQNAIVEFNGIVVGKVSHIEFDRKNPQKVKLLLQVRKSTPVTRGTVANVDISETITEKFTGFPYIFIALHDKGEDLRQIKARPGQSYLTIRMVPVPPKVPALVQLSRTSQQSYEFMHSLLANENIEIVKELIYNLREITSVLILNDRKLNTILNNTEKASKHFEPFLKSTNETMVMLKSETLPEINNLAMNIDDNLDLMQSVLRKIDRNPSVLIRGEAVPQLGPGEVLPAKKDLPK